MLPLFLFFLFTLPSWTMDDKNPSDCVIPIYDLNSETTALLKTNNLINEVSIPLPPQDDELTPYLKTLPRELFWSIISFCEYQEENDDDEDVKITTLFDVAIKCSLISKYFKGRVREMIPALTPLNPSSSPIAAVNFLNQIEHCESNHATLAKSIVGIPNLHDVFPQYYQELNKLIELEPTIRFSPHFRGHKGPHRVKTICENHVIEYPEISTGTLPLRLYSSLTRDPYALTATALGLTTLTCVGGYYIYTSVLDHNEAVYQANISYTEAVNETNANYTQALHKNFLYAQSDAYPIQNKVQSCCMNDIYDLIFEPEPCFKKYFSAKACFNSETICEPGNIDSYLDQLLTRDHYGRTGPNLTQYLYQQFNGSFSPKSVKNLLAGSLDTMCKNGELSNIYAFHDFREHHINLSTQFMHLNVKTLNDECQEWNMYRSRDFSALLMGKFDYDPQCIAQHITPPPQMPQVPYVPIPMAIWAWAGGITGSYCLVALLLSIGWCLLI